MRMSIDTLLNILVVILVAVAVIRADKAARRADVAARIVIENTQAIEDLPGKITPIRSELSRLRSEAETLAELLKQTGDWLRRYDDVLKNNAGLKANVQKLLYQIDVLNGQVIHLNDLDRRLVGVNSSQSAQIDRQGKTIIEQMALIEKLTTALDVKEHSELRQALETITTDIRAFVQGLQAGDQ